MTPCQPCRADATWAIVGAGGIAHGQGHRRCFLAVLKAQLVPAWIGIIPAFFLNFLLGFAALAALVAGVVSLANGVASLLETAASGLSASGAGIGLILVGLMSWIAGVFLAKKLQ